MIKEFYDQKPMKYFDCGGRYDCDSAQAMIQNAGDRYIATRKYDGEWCRIIIDENQQVTIQSRSISKVTGTYGDKTALVPHLVDLLKTLPAGTVLLGELCFEDATSTSRDVGAILRCLPSKAIMRQQNSPLHLRVFDCLAYSHQDLCNTIYFDRLMCAKELVKGIDNSLINLVEYVSTDFEDFLQRILAEGGEGIVIHSKNGFYYPGARKSWLTLKVKKITEELELPIVGFIEPHKTYEGTELDDWKYWIDGQPVTKPYFCGWKNGVIVDNHGTHVRVTSGLNDEDRAWLATEGAQQMLKNGELVAAVSAMEITPDGSLRHPRLIRIRTEA